MAPFDFKDLLNVDQRPGEDPLTKYRRLRFKKINESTDLNELSMKRDKKLPNLIVPAKGKKGVSKFMRKKAAAQAKDDINSSVQSADRKPEKYLKPDGKMGIRMVKTDKEVIKKESIGKTAGDHSHYHLQRAKELAKKDGHDYDKLPKYDRAKPHQDHYHDKAKNEASVLKPTKPTDIIKHAKTLAKNPRDYMMNKKKYLDKARAKVFRMYPKKTNEAINHDDAHRDAQTHSDGSMSVKKIPSMIKKSGDKHLHLHMKSYHKEKDGQAFAKKHGYKVKNYVKTPSGTRMDIHKEMVDPMDLRGRPKKPDPYPKSPYGMKHPLHPLNIQKRKEKEAKKAAATKKEEVDEALTMAQRMKKKRDMRKNKARIAVGRKRARKRMANMKVIKRRSDRQARNMIAKKLTRGISKRDLTPARKREIEKRLESPALQRRIKVLSKRMFKDVRKKEVMRKKS